MQYVCGCNHTVALAVRELWAGHSLCLCCWSRWVRGGKVSRGLGTAPPGRGGIYLGSEQLVSWSELSESLQGWSCRGYSPASCPWHISLPQPLGAQCACWDASHCSVPANVGNVPFQPPCWKNDECREMAVLLQCRALNPEFIPHEVSLLDLISNGSLV